MSLRNSRIFLTAAEVECRRALVAAEEDRLERERSANSRNPRRLATFEGGRVYQALHIESRSVLDALCRVKKCLRRSM